MYSPIVAIFAHPDDEAFGPSGTLALYAKTHDVYLICVTSGGKGENHSKNKGRLDHIREDELRSSSKILGLKEVVFLSFKDGALCNNLYHDIASKLQKILDTIKPTLLITNELRGISGHIDHIAVSMISSYLFEKLSYIKEIHYYCHDELVRKLMLRYYIFVPPGYPHNQIDKEVDISSVWHQKISSIRQHKSQIKDMQKVLALLFLTLVLRGFKKVEHFIIRKK